MSRKICVITGSRAEYGLLYNLIKEIKNDKDLELQLIVTGNHFDKQFGSTYKIIEEEFKIDKKIPMKLCDNSSFAVVSSMGNSMSLFAKAYEELKPDIIIVLGDRYEIFSAASSALIYNIPIAHIHGGEITKGAFDEAIRHSITKMSHIHFTSTNQYKNRVIQLGENPNTEHNVGSLGVENILNLKLLSKDDFEKSINFKLNEKIYL